MKRLLQHGEHTRPRVWPRTPSSLADGALTERRRRVFGEGAENDTRGRVWSPMVL